MAVGGASLSERARRHLWMNFTRLSSFDDRDVPVMVRGEGCHVYDEHGKRYLDGLAGLYCVNAGHGRRELAVAGAAQAEKLGFYPTWGWAHPPAIELAERIASHAPGDLNRVFFTSGGAEAVESALKLARSYHRHHGERGRIKVIAREVAYHGTSLGALSLTGLPAIKEDFAPLAPGACHVPNTDVYGRPGEHPLWSADAIEERIVAEDPATVAAVILEPVQNAGGCLVPPEGYFQRVREICDRHGVLLISDEVICSWGRLGELFGSTRYGYTPDMITTAKGLTSGYAAMGALIASDRIAEAFAEGDATFLHGFTFGGHPVAAAVALANIDILEREDLCGRVRGLAGAFRDGLESLYDIPIVGDVRGDGFFWAIELVRDRDSRTRLSAGEGQRLFAETLGPRLLEAGLLCRLDTRGAAVVQLSPPLTLGQEELDEIVAILRPALAEAAEHVLGETPLEPAARG